MMTTENFVAAIIVVSIIVGILCFVLGYLYARTRIENSILNAKAKAIKTEIKLKEIQMKHLESRLDSIDKNVEIFKVPLKNEKDLEKFLSNLEKEMNNTSDKK